MLYFILLINILSFSQQYKIYQEKEFKSLIQRYCYGASGAIIVYDKRDRESFKIVKEYYNELKKATNLKFSISEKRDVLADMPIILIGLGDSKNVTAEEGKSIVNELGLQGHVEFSETDTENFENFYNQWDKELGVFEAFDSKISELGKKIDEIVEKEKDYFDRDLKEHQIFIENYRKG